MIVYELLKNIQNHGSDGWQFWIDQERISLHKTLEGANEKIKELLQKKLRELPEEMQKNKHITDKEHWNRRKIQIETNKYIFRTDKGWCEDDLYIVKKIVVEE